MKLQTIILAAYISILTIQPVVSQVYLATQQKMECCGDDCCIPNQTDKNKPTKQEQNGMCNPFQSCATCCGCYISKNIIQLLVIQQIKSFQPTFSDNITSDFCSDFFHPPEIV